MLFGYQNLSYSHQQIGIPSMNTIYWMSHETLRRSISCSITVPVPLLIIKNKALKSGFQGSVHQTMYINGMLQ